MLTSLAASVVDTLGKRVRAIFSAIVYLYFEKLSLLVGAWDGLRDFIVIKPGSSI